MVSTPIFGAPGTSITGLSESVRSGRLPLTQFCSELVIWRSTA